MKKALFLTVLVLLVSASGFAQFTPKKGSKLRSTLIETLRKPVKKELKQHIIFRVERLSVQGNWAFLAGEPLNRAGKHPDYSYTVYGEDIVDGLFDNNIFALLRKSSGRWRVVEYLIGCTDVCYLEWHKTYKAPFGIFGLPPEAAGVGSTLELPQKGSTLRSSILNSLRTPVEKQLKQRIIFRVSDIRVVGDWAFVGGEPLSPSGKMPNYNGTIYKDDVEDGFFDNNVFGLLKKKNGKWTVVTHLIGCTDVCYLGWADQYKLPKELFPFSQ